MCLQKFYFQTADEIARELQGTAAKKDSEEGTPPLKAVHRKGWLMLGHAMIHSPSVIDYMGVPGQQPGVCLTLIFQSDYSESCDNPADSKLTQLHASFFFIDWTPTQLQSQICFPDLTPTQLIWIRVRLVPWSENDPGSRIRKIQDPWIL